MFNSFNTTECGGLCCHSPVSVKATEIAIPVPLYRWFWISLCNAVDHDRISLVCLSRILGIHSELWCHCSKSKCCIICKKSGTVEKVLSRILYNEELCDL